MREKGFAAIIILLVLLLLVAVGYLGYSRGCIKFNIPETARVTNIIPSLQPSPSLNPTSTPTSNIISVDEKTNKYINPLGFTFTYPKYNQTPTTCQELQTSKSGIMPMKIFEQPFSNTLFISDESVIELRSKAIGGGSYVSDYDTCKIVSNSLDLIKNGYDNGMPVPNNLSRPRAIQINYKRINNDGDLLSLAQSIYKNCYIGPKKLMEDSSDVYSVELDDINGSHDMESGCPTNFVYIFLYSPRNQVAVITSGFQDVPFSGTNGQYLPEFEFPSK